MIEKKKFSKEELSSVCGGKVEERLFYGRKGDCFGGEAVFFEAFGVYTDDRELLAIFDNEDDANKFDTAYKAGEVPQAILDLDDAYNVGIKFLGK